MSMLKKMKLPGLIVLIGVASLAILIVARPKPEPTPMTNQSAHIKVAVARAEYQATRLAVTAQGTVLPKREIDVIAQVSGQIVKVEPAFVDGGFFAGAQALLHIDDREYKIALLNAKARVAEAERLLAEEKGRSLVAKREWRDLGSKEANDLFVRKPHLVAAQANLESAQGEVSRAELNLERTKITVPFDGRIRQVYADLGQYVTVGTRLATVYDSTVVEVRLPLTEQQASLIDLPLSPRSNGTATTDSGSDRELPLVTIKGSIAGTAHQWQGVLARTDAFVDSDSRMYYAVVEVQNPFASRGSDAEPQVPLLPGLFVEAEINGKKIDKVTVLPRSAVFQRDKIAILDDKNTVEYRSVNVLHKSDSQIWVQGDFADQTLVSVEKQMLTPEGTIVEPLLNINQNPGLAETAVAAVEE